MIERSVREQTTVVVNGGKRIKKNLNSATFCRTLGSNLKPQSVKETKSATINIFQKNLFVFKTFVKVELNCIFTINLFTISENFMGK